MEWWILLWIISLLVIGALIFLSVFSLISFADLESDYINPIDLCNRLNKCILPEYIAHFALTALFLLTGSWLEFLFNLPLAIFHCYNISTKHFHLDATAIFSTLPKEKKKSYVKLGFYMLAFFLYLYRLIYLLVKGVMGSKSARNVVTLG